MLKQPLIFSTIFFSTSCSNKLPTLGGVHFWDDQEYYQDHRLQKHSLIPLYRRLDHKARLLSIGSKKHCLINRNKKKSKPNLLILVHGLCRSHHSMKPLERLKNDKTQVIRITYSSLFSDLDEVSHNLNNIIQNHSGSKIILVGHSMGGLVIRRWASNYKAKHVCGAVTLGTPHQGAKIVRTLETLQLHHLTGVNKKLLAENKEFKNEDKNSFPIITVSGVPKWGYYFPFGYFFKDKSDGSVRECEAHLPWSYKRYQINSSHSFMMHHPQVKSIISSFLKS